SPFDLNIEHGKIERPAKASIRPGTAAFERIWIAGRNGEFAKPLIRFGTPVFDHQGRKRGIVLLNYFGGHLLQRISECGRRAAEGECVSQLMLLNSDGYWLAAGVMALL
ncbi:MAG: hypothetical protein K1000chlam4_00992, partial [Chlamydiae bacterium]|nr:hypothetical protein [Chlamydiota bacterium]